LRAGTRRKEVSAAVAAYCSIRATRSRSSARTFK
jgi:hypothetical protein